jgi:hypothetical protein
MEEAIIRAIAKALLARFPRLKPVLPEEDLVVLLGQSWSSVRTWADEHGKSLTRAVVEFRRAAFSVVKRLARRQKDFGSAGNLYASSLAGPSHAQLAVFSAVTDSLQIEIENESKRRLAELR